MDPDTTLAQMREAYRSAEEAAHGPVVVGALWDLAHSFRELDLWLSKGGFLPADWESGPQFADAFGEDGTPLGS